MTPPTSQASYRTPLGPADYLAALRSALTFVLWPQTPMSTRSRVTAITGNAATVLALLLVFAAPAGGLRVVGALLFACTCGASITAWIDAGEDLAQAGLTLVLSLALLAMCAAVMIWLASWHPVVLFVLIALVSIVSCTTRLWIWGPLGTGPTNRERFDAIWPAVRESARGAGPLWFHEFSPALLVLGLVLWMIGVSKVSPDNIHQAGLLVGTNVFLPIGIVVLVASFLVELATRDPRGWQLGLNLVLLLVAIYGSVPIVFNAPEYSWVYKHIGVISSFQRYGRVTDPSDIYQEWPTLFAGVGIISSLAKVNSVSFAQWGPLAFELADVVLFVAIARLFLRDRRAVWLALFIYEGLVAWVGQDYLSPQAFAYTLWLGMALIILRWLRAEGDGIAPILRWLGDKRLPLPRSHPIRRAHAWLTRDMPEMSTAVNTAARRVPLALLLVIYAAIVTAHQLTPYMAIASVAALVIVKLIKPGWFLVALALMAGAFLLVHYHLIATQYGGLFGGDPIANAGGAIGVSTPSQAQLWSGRCTYLVMAVMWFGGAWILLRNVRRPGPVLIPGLLAYSPFLVIFASNYGGEAIYRVFLFSAPWCAILIAGYLTSLRWILVRNALINLCAIAVVLLSVQGQFGTVTANGFTHSEVAASEWLYRHVPSSAFIVLPSNNFPTLEAANYNKENIQLLPADEQFGQSWMNEGHLDVVKRWIRGFGYRQNYIVVSDSMLGWANFYDVTPGYRKLEGALRDGFLGAVPVYSNASTTIYRIRA
jgi:hypothetical protein